METVKPDSEAKADKLPSLFVPHGAPDLLLTKHPAAEHLRNLHTLLPTPDGIVIVSAHWETSGLQLTNSAPLETIYDFSGFPRELYKVRYPAHSEPWLVEKTENHLKSSGYEVKQTGRGLDHGAWAPLSLMYPGANIPVVQLSLDMSRPYEELYDIGKALEPLRSQNILIIGSGVLVHNLALLSHKEGPAPDWAQQFDQWVDDQIAEHNVEALANFQHQAPFARKAHPSPEHYLPLLVALGAAGDQAKAEKTHASYTYHTLSMSTWMFR